MNRVTSVVGLIFAAGVGVLTSVTAFAATPLPRTDLPESVVVTDATRGIQSAWYDGATARYAHGVLGDAIEGGELHVKTAGGKVISLLLDLPHVFEDIAPRLADLDGDGQHEIVTIRSHKNKGGQIAVYGLTDAQPDKLSLLASTPYIGRSYRWLAPVGIADFNGDGVMDIAYIDRPHLAKLLRVWSYTQNGLEQIAQKAGLTNHRIGHAYITGGVQRCKENASMITVDANWSRVVRTYFEQGRLLSEDIGPYLSRNDTEALLRCPQPPAQ